MSIDPKDMEFIQTVDGMLQEGLALPAIAEKLGENFQGMYQRITRLGYRVKTTKRLEAIRSPQLSDGDESK